jgi:serine/threonine protein kinase
MHRDIKPKNLLMANREDTSSLRIADFGLCRRIGASSPEVGSRRRRSVTRAFVGTAPWMAPEVLVCACEEAGGYSFPADIWSAGCVIYSLCSGSLSDTGPFIIEEDLETHAEADVLSSMFRALLEQQLTMQHIANPGARSLLQAMLKTVPIERISARQALEQEWLAPLLAPALPPMPTAPPDTTRGRRLSNPAAKSQSIGSQLSPVVVMGRQMASQTQGSNVLHSMDTGTHVASPRTERTSPITPLSIGMQRLSTSPRPPQQLSPVLPRFVQQLANPNTQDAFRPVAVPLARPPPPSSRAGKRLVPLQNARRSSASDPEDASPTGRRSDPSPTGRKGDPSPPIRSGRKSLPRPHTSCS